MASRSRSASESDGQLRKALKILGCEYGTSSVKRWPKIAGVTRFGDLFIFTRDEADQLEAVQDLIERYIAQPQPPRPLSLAVFGPPGSGKSFTVKQILQTMDSALGPKLSRIEVNLTQIPDADALGKVLARAARSADRAPPVFFFDEFDAPKDGASFGWLSWFLAPMQDGEFVYDGEVIPLRRAVYVFAGGTATTLEEFSGFERFLEFRRAKGPDFISRLRGFLDIQGANSEPRLLRRAVLFRSGFMSRAREPGGGKFRVDPEVMNSLLQVGRYRHGARSIAAVVDLSNIDPKAERLGWKGLPKDHLLRLHIDRGPLDAKVIGGAIAFSGYHEDPDSEIADLWREVAHRLWNEGATLSYAGRWAEGSAGWLMKFLQQELETRPPEPSPLANRRRRPDPWLESFLDNTQAEREKVNKAIPPAKREGMGLDVTFASHLTSEERRMDEYLHRTLEYFRRRLAVTDGSVARFVVAGATSAPDVRFPGIPEEVMLSLAQGKPVYIAGGFGGAAADVGSILGLAHLRRGEVPVSLRQSPNRDEQSLRAIVDKLRPGPWTKLPIDAGGLVLFLKTYALGGSKWPNNGLTFDENRELFASRNRDRIVEMVATGLKRQFGRTEPIQTAK
jgi:hypothetical protein